MRGSVARACPLSRLCSKTSGTGWCGLKMITPYKQTTLAARFLDDVVRSSNPRQPPPLNRAWLAFKTKTNSEAHASTLQALKHLSAHAYTSQRATRERKNKRKKMKKRKRGHDDTNPKRRKPSETRKNEPSHFAPKQQKEKKSKYATLERGFYNSRLSILRCIPIHMRLSNQE